MLSLISSAAAGVYPQQQQEQGSGCQGGAEEHRRRRGEPPTTRNGKVGHETEREGTEHARQKTQTRRTNAREVHRITQAGKDHTERWQSRHPHLYSREDADILACVPSRDMELPVDL